MKVAIVHDYLTVYAGGERVTKEILALYPEADIFTLLDIMDKDRAFLKGHNITTTFLQRLPGLRKSYRNFFPLFPRAIESLDLRGYDLVISNSHSVAKGVLTSPSQLHISVCLSPARWAWDLEDQYLQESGLDRGVKGWLVRYFLQRFRTWDLKTPERVDYFISISNYIQERVQRLYGRESTVIYPPVDTDAFPLQVHKQEYYLVASRLVWYKKARVAIEAFNAMPNHRLIVAGGGPQEQELRALAGPNVEVLGHVDEDTLRSLLQGARALIFPPEEDFGIVPLEAQACGTPVLAFGRGGATETVVDGVTGLFFKEQTPQSVQAIVNQFETNEMAWDPAVIHEHALTFGVARFQQEFSNFVNGAIEEFQARSEP